METFFLLVQLGKRYVILLGETFFIETIFDTFTKLVYEQYANNNKILTMAINSCDKYFGVKIIDTFV